ncbi:hypothetical protein IG511_12580 [Vibrio cholerae]|uniref:hypothetical protein n=1 Tax=Vibrio cholerae TaxID=666 RepID=UPI00227205C6|nr:hypothetical protein [Vibrio cholerae]MCX9489763.1 hypothetical protein [Vibrio cholerae]MCX9521892.1 hypothetical protein [Vibrio cholerae]MCX9523811.1 hypothetical protein [Vibrio cholerae]
MKKLLALNSIVLIAIFSSVYCYGRQISYSDLKDLLDILKNASAMIFTIVGIWLAYIYPNAVTALVKPESISLIAGKKDAKRIEMLVGIIISSAVVIVGIIFFFALKLLITPMPFYYSNIWWIKPIAITFVLMLTYIQIFSIGKVVWSNILFINDLHNKLNKQQLEDQN